MGVILCAGVLLLSLAGLSAGLPGVAGAGEKPKLEPYGFLRFDVMASDSRMGDNLVPMWVSNEHDGSVFMDDASLAFHPRLTRLGTRFQDYALGAAWKADAGVEIDFQVFDAGSESRQVPRLRLGYVRVHFKDLHIMAGQHWDLISPLFPNVNLNGVNWNAGNTGDRRPQVRVTLSRGVGSGGVSLAAAVAQFGAVNMSDIDGNGIPDGQDSAMPMLQGRLGIDQELMDGFHFQAGLWGHYAKERAAIISGVNASADYESWCVGGDAVAKVQGWLMIQGEIWSGENLSDIRAGIGQNVNPTIGAEIGALGGWIEAVITPIDKLTLIGGYTIDDVENDDISAGQRSKNQAPYGAIRFRPWKDAMLSLEYMRFETSYVGFDETSVNNHVVVHVMYFL
jgi:hypothetical protein